MVQKFKSYHFMREIKHFRYFKHIRVIPGLLGGHFYPFWGPFLTGVKKRVIFFGTVTLYYKPDCTSLEGLELIENGSVLTVMDLIIYGCKIL